MKMISGTENGGRYQILRIVAHLSQIHTGSVAAPNCRDREQTIRCKHFPLWKLELSSDVMESDDSLSDEEFWTC